MPTTTKKRQAPSGCLHLWCVMAPKVFFCLHKIFIYSGFGALMQTFLNIGFCMLHVPLSSRIKKYKKWVYRHKKSSQEFAVWDIMPSINIFFNNNAKFYTHKRHLTKGHKIFNKPECFRWFFYTDFYIDAGIGVKIFKVLMLEFI